MTFQHAGIAERLEADPTPEPALEPLCFADAEATVTVVEENRLPDFAHATTMVRSTSAVR